MNQKFKEIAKLLQKLPGVGPRQAARFVLALLEKDQKELTELGDAIVSLKKDIHRCKECFNVSDNHLCLVCSDPKRDKSKIMVVEKITDLASIERTGLYKGVYHVLGGAINPLDKITPDSLTIKQLRERAHSHDGPIELIIATNPNTAGETTALYLKSQLNDVASVTLTRLARGLSSSSMLEYADETTLKHALESRK